MRYVVLAAVAATLASTPAMAEDFAGPYIGAGVTLDNIQGSGQLEGYGFSGVGGTVFAGYDMAVSNGVFAGVEANFDLSTADDDIAPNTKIDMGWGISGRLGTKLNANTGLYGRLGYAQARAKTAGFSSEWGEGVKYGLGIQTGLSDQLSLRAEVNQINYEGDLINNQAQLSLSYGF
jgi:outer membrane immunogenic protein